MMDQQAFLAMWDQIRQAHGIALRLVQALPAGQIDSQPIKNMRSPKELVVHMYGMMIRNVPEGVASGEIKLFDEKAAGAGIKTHADLEKFVRDCWDAGNKAAQAITDANLQATVQTPWGMSFPGYAAAGVIMHEFFHHRGQLYCYLRALGQDVPMMWDFAHNEPGLQPQH
jgi:uncharacterized damage-inducible protein DinB